MRLFIFLFPGLFAAVSGIVFTTPPPFGVPGEYSSNSAVVLGSTINVQWAFTNGEVEKNMSLTLYQDAAGDQFENVFISQPNIPTSFAWTVSTKKDLKKTNIFYFATWFEGSTSPQAESHYFNITDGSAPSVSSAAPSSTSSSSSSSSASSTSSSSPSSSATSSSATSASTSATPASTTSPTSSSSSIPISAASTSGLSAGAKAGIGIGATFGAIISICAAALVWILVRRKETSRQNAARYPDARYQHNSLPAYETGSQMRSPIFKHELPAS